MSNQITERDALIVIDIQNDFCPGGALAVTDGDSIVPEVVAFAQRFKHVVVTQDWHPPAHASFATTHAAEAFSNIDLEYGSQTLWPDHCVQGSAGAQFHAGLDAVVNKACAIVRKGMNPNVDSYSAFYENDKTTATGLAGYLCDRNIDRVFVVGLAYDFCVAYSALDAVGEGFDAVVVKDLCRAIAMPVDDERTTVDVMEAKFEAEGVRVENSTAFKPSGLGL